MSIGVFCGDGNKKGCGIGKRESGEGVLSRLSSSTCA